MSQRTRVLGDRYELEEPVGRGGMAEVFKATDRTLGRTVAVKILAVRFASDPRFVSRFRREAQAAAALNHPNVVSVFDTGSDGDDHYIVMEYVEGETLADLLAREGSLPADRAAAIAGAVAAALGAAHDKGLVHRDVKPANVMLTGAGEVKVMDFGIARAAAHDTLTQTGMVMGTASYLSPEQAQGHPVDPRSDVYSLGCVLYEMLTGRPPFTGDSAVSIAYKHVREHPLPVSRLSPDVPEDLAGVTMRALSKDVDRRFASGREMHEALAGAAGAAALAATEPMAAGGDTAVLPAGEPTAVPPDERRPAARWLPWAIGAVLLAALVALALVAFPDAEPTDGGRERQPAAEEQPPPEEQAPPEEEVPEPPDLGAAASVEDAVAALEGFLTEALEAGTITETGADEIGRRIEEALNHYYAGEQEEALVAVSEAVDATDELLARGEIASEAWAAELRDGLEALGAAMQASPIAPPDEGEEGEGNGEEGPPGEGRGRGEGRGGGNDKD
ncbi:MAG TPA: protein kinase [Actinomycetota bacterium]|nr:protein kinase [Actinomycetota bacterium]